MLKLLLICTTVSFCCSGITQEKAAMNSVAYSEDSLQQFTYFIFGASGGYYNRTIGRIANFVDGSCFFIKTDKQMFLGSAKHVLTSWDPILAKKTENFPDTLYVRLKEKKTGKDTLYPFSIKKIKDTITGDFYYKDPDVFFIGLPNMDNYIINSIESFIVPNLGDTAIQKIGYFFGFPFISKPSFEEFMSISSSKAKITMTTKLSTVQALENNHFDDLNYAATLDSGTIVGGDSGSPIFSKERGGQSWIFLGVVSRFSLEDNTVYIVKPHEVIQKLLPLLKN